MHKPRAYNKHENLWMIIHQKPYVLASRVITFCMARGLVCELNVKQMNWAAYEWTSQE